MPRGAACAALGWALVSAAGAAQVQGRAPLQQYWSDPRQDFWVVATPGGIHAAAAVFHYRFVRTEAYVLTTARTGTLPLVLYWNEQRHDNRNVALAASGRDAVAQGYSEKAVEGYVFAADAPGLVPLKLYENGRDSITVATAAGERLARRQGYHFVSIEGYVYPATGK